MTQKKICGKVIKEYTIKEYTMDNGKKISLELKMNISYLLQKQKMFQIL